MSNFKSNNMAVSTAAAIIIGSAVAATATVAGGIINRSSVNRSNQANKDIMREQMSYQTSERLATQEYNTPENQRARFEQAGINPYMALGGLDAGNTSAQSGVQTPSMIPNTAVGDMLSQLGVLGNDTISRYQDASMKGQQIEQLSMDNRIKSITLQNESARQLLELSQKRQELLNSKLDEKLKSSQLRSLDTNISILENNLKYLDDYNKSRNDEMRYRSKLVQRQADGQLIENEIKTIMKSNLPRLQAAQIEQMAASSYASYMSGISSYEQSELTKEQKITEAYKAIGQSISNQIENKELKLKQLHLSEAELRALRTGDVRKARDKNHFRVFDDVVQYLVGLPVSVLGVFK